MHMDVSLPCVHGVPPDEFGSRFDVANCSICLHWLNSREDGSVIFSSGYKGCHVLFKVTLLSPPWSPPAGWG